MLDLRLTPARMMCVAGVRPASLPQGDRGDRSRASACRNRVDGRRYARWAVRAAVGADMTLQAARSAISSAGRGSDGLQGLLRASNSAGKARRARGADPAELPGPIAPSYDSGSKKIT